MKKRLLSFGICAALTLTLCGCDNKPQSTPDIGISAPDDGRVNPIEESKPEWEYEEQTDGSLELTAYNGRETAVKIPKELDGKPIVRLGYGFKVNNAYASSVEIPACIEYISTHISCEGIAEYIVEDGNEHYYSKDGILYEKDKYSGAVVLHSCPQAKKGEITVPNDVSRIGEYAFDRCAKVTSVVLPEGIKSIGAGAFGKCSALTDVNIPKSVEEIGGYAFSGCAKLETLDIPETVSDIGQHPFDGTPFLNKLREKSPLVVINDMLLDGVAASGEVIVPNGVKEIVYEAFKPFEGSNTTITKIILPDSVERIGGSAFAYCEALTEVRLPAGIKQIGNWFTGCKSITEFTVPDGVEKIDSFFFNRCENLTMITLPDSITEIDEFNFLDESDKASVTYKGKTYARGDFEMLFADVEKNALSNRPEWEYEEQRDGGLRITAYNGSAEIVKIPAEIDGKPVKTLSISEISPHLGAKTVEIPASVEVIWARNFGETITEFVVAEGNTNYYSKDGMLFVRETDALAACPQGRSGAVNVPEGTKGITASAFSDCVKVTSVSLPEEVTFIGQRAFSGCSELTNVNIPSTVMEIGAYAFVGCAKLEVLDVPETVTDIGRMFLDGTPALEKLRGKDALVVINGILVDGNTAKGAVIIPDTVTKIADGAFTWGYAGNSEITSVTIPDSVKKIGQEAFARCERLSEVKLPSGIKELPTRAFYGCSALKKIDIPDGVETIGMGAFADCKNLENVTVPDSVKNVFTDSCFDDCPKLNVIFKGKTYAAANIEEFYTAVEENA